LSKEDLVFKRNKDGQIVPRIVELTENKEITILPITFGEFQELTAQMKNGLLPTEISLKVLKEHLIEPKLDDDDLKNLKPMISNLILMKILSYSSISQEEAPEDDIKKSLPKEKSTIMAG